MLEIEIPSRELWDEENEMFMYTKGATLKLEHSLISISKWEAKWKKPFLNNDDKTVGQILDYVRCMSLASNVDPDVYKNLDKESLRKIMAYINDSMTATTFAEIPGAKSPSKPRHTKITSEIIYYWMTALNIPIECEKWHLNRLLTLIRVCNEKNAPPKKMSKAEQALRRSSLNAQRRKAMNSRG